MILYRHDDGLFLNKSQIVAIYYYQALFHAFLHLVPNMSLGVRVLALGTKEIYLGIITLPPGNLQECGTHQ